jgi:hypothetical protein
MQPHLFQEVLKKASAQGEEENGDHDAADIEKEADQSDDITMTHTNKARTMAVMSGIVWAEIQLVDSDKCYETFRMMC